jgi:CubicO group peptidase (beta-lactamase class C family)
VGPRARSTGPHETRRLHERDERREGGEGHPGAQIAAHAARLDPQRARGSRLWRREVAAASSDYGEPKEQVPLWTAAPKQRSIRAMRRLAVLSLLVLGACADEVTPVPQAPAPPPPPVAATPAPSTPPAAPATTPVMLTANAPEATPAGATFTAPAGWSFVVDGPAAKLTGPEPDLHVAVVDSTSATPDDAVAAAWRTVHPGFKWALKLASTQPGRHGWEEKREYEYEVSPDEKLVVFASARRKSTRWTVVLLKCGNASFEKRIADIERVADTLQPAGYTRESFAGKTPHKLDAALTKQIVDSVEKMRQEAGIPGVGLALVQDGKVVYEGGLGVREMGKADKVDAHTKFIIASNTKALTTLLLAKLVDEGKLSWETPVTQLYPEFKLGDAETTRQVLVKHLICACTGMPRQDFEWLFNFEKQTPRSQVDLLGNIHPTTKFGETFQYSNSMASAAGFIAGHVLDPKKELGAAYDDAMRSRVLGPLGMTETTFDYATALRENHATSHEYDVDGKLALALMDLNRAAISLRPAGEAWSTAHDMAKYVSMELAKGTLPGGKRYVSEDALLARRKPQVRIGEFTTYGMGLEVNDEWGVPFVHHGGDLIGFHSDMFWIPGANVGGVILTNGPGWLIRGALIRKTMEVLYDGRPEAEDDAASGVAQFKAEIASERPRLTIPPDPSLVAGLAKHYANASLGDIVVTTEGTTCTFRFGGWKTPVATRKNDDGTLSIVTIAPGVDGIPFIVEKRDGKRVLVVRDMQHEYAFTEAG